MSVHGNDPKRPLDVRHVWFAHTYSGGRAKDRVEPGKGWGWSRAPWVSMHQSMTKDERHFDGMAAITPHTISVRSMSCRSSRAALDSLHPQMQGGPWLSSSLCTGRFRPPSGFQFFCKNGFLCIYVQLLTGGYGSSLALQGRFQLFQF